jgi:hypothetical protein
LLKLSFTIGGTIHEVKSHASSLKRFWLVFGWEVLGSNLGQRTAYPESVLSFPSGKLQRSAFN